MCNRGKEPLRAHTSRSNSIQRQGATIVFIMLINAAAKVVVAFETVLARLLHSKPCSQGTGNLRAAPRSGHRITTNPDHHL